MHTSLKTIAAALLLVSACAPAAAPAPAPSAAASASPQRGGTFVNGIGADPQTANMDLTTDTNSSQAFIQLYSGIVAVKRDETIVPDLADSWTISPDGLRYEFKLNKNAKFHDGTPVTSADVQYSLEIANKYQAKSGPIFKNIVKYETPDANTIVLTLGKPSAVFLKSLTTSNVCIISKAMYAGNPDPRNDPRNTTAPMGSGPFKFKEWVKGDHVTLVRNENYFKPGLPYLDQWIARIVPNPASRTVAFQVGEVDFIAGTFVSRDQMPEIKTVAGVQLDEHAGFPGEGLFEFNSKRKPFDDVRVREAIAHAINQQQVVEKAYSGVGAKVSKSHIPEDLKLFFDPTAKLPAYDVALANKMLDDAGYKKGADGTRFRAKLSFLPTVVADKLSGDVVRDNLKDIGVQIDLDPLDSSVVAKQVFTDGNFDLWVSGVTSSGDPELGIARFYVSSSIGVNNGNAARYSNPEIDKLFADAGSATDVAKRKDAYAKVQQILMKDLPTFPLIDYVNVDVIQGKIAGFGFGPYIYSSPELIWRRP